MDLTAELAGLVGLDGGPEMISLTYNGIAWGLSAGTMGQVLFNEVPSDMEVTGNNLEDVIREMREIFNARK